MKDRVSLLVVSGDLRSLPHILGVGDPDPGELKQAHHLISKHVQQDPSVSLPTARIHVLMAPNNRSKTDEPEGPSDA